MKAEFKAQEIAAAMAQYTHDYEVAKRCAIIAVNQMIEAQKSCYGKDVKHLYNVSDEFNYLQKVKLNIKLL